MILPSKVLIIEEFNSLLTKDEEEMQFFLQVVEKNQKNIPIQATEKSVIDAVSKSWNICIALFPSKMQ